MIFIYLTIVFNENMVKININFIKIVFLTDNLLQFHLYNLLLYLMFEALVERLLNKILG